MIKRQELLDKGQKPQFGAKVAHSRLEIRRKPGGKKTSLYNLLKASNPLKQFRVYDSFKVLPETHQHHTWLWFIDSCRQRGINQALSLAADEDVRADLESCLNECQEDVFPAKKIWGSWPDSLRDAGLFD